MKNIALITLIRLFGAGLQFGFALVVSRLLTPSQAGLFFFSYAIVLILSTFARLGTELSGMRVVASAHSREALGELRLATVTRFLLTFLMALGLGVVLSVLSHGIVQARFEDPMALWVIVVLAVAVPALSLLGLLAEFLKAVGCPNWGVTIQNIVVPGGATVVMLIASMSGIKIGPLFVAVTVAVVGWVSLAGAVFIWLRWYRNWVTKTPYEEVLNDNFKMNTVLQTLVALVREAPKLTVVSTVSIAMQWMGAVVLGIVSSPNTVAGYSIVIRMSIVVSTVNSAVASVMAPRMAAAHVANDISAMRYHAHRMSIIVFVTTFPILVILWVGASYWLSFFFGVEYSDYAGALRVLILGQIVASLIGHSGTILVMSGEYGYARGTSLIALTLVLIFMPPLSAYFGANGAAIAMSLAVTGGHLAGLRQVHRTLGFLSMPLTLSDFQGLNEKSEYQ